MKIYKKLVRDNIPEIIKKAGKKANIHILNDQEYMDALNAKLVEEMNEYMEEYDIKELADLQELIYSIVVAKGFSLEEFEQLRLSKARQNGSFTKKLFLDSVEE